MRTRSIFKFIPFVLTLLFLFVGCSKDPNEPEEETPLPSAMQFSWSVNGGNTINASDGYFISSYNEIIATKTGATAIDIILDDLSNGTYAISPSNGITLEYFDGSTTYTGESGSVVISANTGTSLSGSFNCVFNGGTTTITGQFSNLPKK